MRPIKFRAWDKDNEIMVYSEDNQNDEFTFIAEEGGLQFYYIDKSDRYLQDTNSILMQYTGLKDKNGKEIYEGDEYHLGDPNITYTVVWHDTGLIGKQNGSSSYAGLSHWQDRIEIIGNIYEHPHLLKE